MSNETEVANAWDVFENKRGLSQTEHNLNIEELGFATLYSCSPIDDPQTVQGWVGYLADGRYVTMVSSVSHASIVKTLQSMASAS